MSLKEERNHSTVSCFFGSTNGIAFVQSCGLRLTLLVVLCFDGWLRLLGGDISTCFPACTGERIVCLVVCSVVASPRCFPCCNGTGEARATQHLKRENINTSKNSVVHTAVRRVMLGKFLWRGPRRVADARVWRTA